MLNNALFLGKSFPLEAQLYFYSNQSSSLRQALDTKDGVVGLAMLFQEDVPPYGEELFLLNDHGRNDHSNASDLTKMSFYSAAMIPQRIDAFYFYDGSFIDSDCHEAMKWVIDKRVRSVYQDSHLTEYKQFRKTCFLCYCISI